MISSSRSGAILRPVVVAVLLAAAAVSVSADSAVAYRFSFPEPQHHWMQVEATFGDLGAGALELRMSRTSPGRYATHEFAKNVYDVHVLDAEGRELETTRPDPFGWTVPAPGTSVTVKYKVFGDRVDGTYLGIDATHAHINMPATIMWARGLDDRPAVVTFAPPPGARWQVATQLQPSGKPFEFTAPNLQYLMDSPAEFGPVAMRQFSVDGRTFRFAAHHLGSDGDLDAFVKDVEAIVREQGEIFGEYPVYDTGAYTFLADYLPWASGDGMEHRNSTVMTSASSLRAGRLDLLDTVAHEFFHCWNVERIRPRSLEPFNFENANVSGELWLGEGFTQYYGPLTLKRAGFVDESYMASTFAGLIRSVALDPAHTLRSAEEMSRMAAFTDGGRTIDRTNWYTTYISYYSWGGAIALALDLSLRARSDGRVTLDDYMRTMWQVHGKPDGARPGYVARPYTIADAEARLAEVSGDAAFARDFFVRYIRGREIADYRALLDRAGFALRKRSPGRAWWGPVRVESRSGALRLAEAPEFGTPLYAAGLDLDDEVRQLAGTRVTSIDDLAAVLRRHKPGDTVPLVFVDRAGVERKSMLTLGEDPEIDLLLLENTGQQLTAAQKTFRERWLN